MRKLLPFLALTLLFVMQIAYSQGSDENFFSDNSNFFNNSDEATENSNLLGSLESTEESTFNTSDSKAKSSGAAKRLQRMRNARQDTSEVSNNNTIESQYVGRSDPTESLQEIRMRQDPQLRELARRVEESARERLNRDVERLCGEMCRVVRAEAVLDDYFEPSQANLGFEEEVARANRDFTVKYVKARVLVNRRFGESNISRFKQVLGKIIKTYPWTIKVQVARVSYPVPTDYLRSELSLKQDFMGKIKQEVQLLLNAYCGQDCKLHSVSPRLTRMNLDDARTDSSQRVLISNSGTVALYVEGVGVSFSINNALEEKQKRNIYELLSQHLSLYGVARVTMNQIVFPKSSSQLAKERKLKEDDPHGFKRLTEQMRIFKENAVTKEIFKSESSTSQKQTSETSSETSLSEKNRFESERNSSIKNQLEKSQMAETLSKEEGKEFWTQENMLLVGGIVLLLLLVAALGLRFVVTGKRMQQVVTEGLNQGNAGGHEVPQGMGGAPGQQPVYMMGGGAPAPQAGSVASSPVDPPGGGVSAIGINRLKDEIMQFMIEEPRASAEVFSRVLKEEGVEITARYVALFGEVVVTDLIKDPELKKDLNTLAEYVHVNHPEVNPEEALELLRSLKLKFTAGKLKLMTSRSMAAFDFLKTYRSQQIYELIVDEVPKMQAIVLSQLKTGVRREVFEYFDGEEKVELLKELGQGRRISREYLLNVAQALKKKTAQRPDLNAEQMSGADVLLDLLERSHIESQREIIAELDKNQPDSAKLVRSKLVTVETLGYLKESRLLDIFLGLEPTALQNFLVGTREHIVEMLLQRIPRDLAADWQEMIQTSGRIDSETYQLAEMQVLTRLRQAASAGFVDIYEINEEIYPNGELVQFEDSTRVADFQAKRPLVA